MTSGLPTLGGNSLFRVRVRISNLTALDAAHDRDAALARSLVSHAHSAWRSAAGEFVSLLDPSEPYKDAAAACRNLGTFPVLAGEEGGRRDTLLSSLIILYDYPRVAAGECRSVLRRHGNRRDARAANHDAHRRRKREMGQVDERARQLLERTEALPPEHLMTAARRAARGSVPSSPLRRTGHERMGVAAPRRQDAGGLA